MSNKYHVGLGVFGIYAGILKNKEEWKDKSEVTREAIDAVAGFLLTSEKECRFEWQGKKYVMRVEEYQEDTDESRFDKAIANVSYIRDALMAYRNIVESGCCNDCRIAKPYSCEHLPKPGQLVRYNCPFYERKEDTDE